MIPQNSTFRLENVERRRSPPKLETHISTIGNETSAALQVGTCTASEDRCAGNKPRERWGSLDTLQALLIDTITAHILTLFTGPNPPKKTTFSSLSLPATHEGRPPGFCLRGSDRWGSRKARRRVCHFVVRGGQAPSCCLYYLLFLSSLSGGTAGAVTYVPSAWFGIGKRQCPTSPQHSQSDENCETRTQ